MHALKWACFPSYRSGPTSAAVVSAAVSVQRHPTVTASAPIQSSTVAVQTYLTWPSGQEQPQHIPHKSISSQSVSPNRLTGGASAASALQLPAAIPSSSAAKYDSPGKGVSVRRPSPSASFKNPRKLNLTRQAKVVGRRWEDHQGRTQSSLQTTDIPLCRWRWTMHFQILTARILFDFFAYDFTMEHSWSVGQQGGTWSALIQFRSHRHLPPRNFSERK